jgi:anti-sigma B factor antagonist
MKFVITEYARCNLFEIIGRIDSHTAPQINQALKALFTDKQFHIVVDMQKVTYISSSGILVFVNAQKQLMQQNCGEIVFASVPDLVFSGFALAGFNTLFKFYDDVVSAVGSF